MNLENKKSKNNKTLIIIIIIIVILLIFGILSTKLLNNKNNSIPNNVHKNTNIYGEITKALEEKTDVIIYYYDSSTNNKYNSEVEAYLNEIKINYYIYDHAKIDKEDYHKFLTRLNIDENIFGMPAIIYMHNGMMYANIINIDSIDNVKRFIEDYNLTNVK